MVLWRGRKGEDGRNVEIGGGGAILFFGRSGFAQGLLERSHRTPPTPLGLLALLAIPHPWEITPAQFSTLYRLGETLPRSGIALHAHTSKWSCNVKNMMKRVQTYQAWRTPILFACQRPTQLHVFSLHVAFASLIRILKSLGRCFRRNGRILQTNFKHYRIMLGRAAISPLRRVVCMYPTITIF